MKKYRGGLFDCDGTLVDSEVIAMLVAINILADAVQKQRPEVKIDRLALVQEFAGWHFDKMISEVGCRYDVLMDEPSLQAIKIPQTIKALEAVRVIPGIPQFLQHLCDRSIEIAVVTSSEFSRVNPCLDTTDIAKFFSEERKFSAADSLPLPRFKPLPDIYLHAMAKMELQAEECVAFEDSVSGVKSARAAGIDVIGIVAATHIPEAQKHTAAQKLLDHGAGIVVEHAGDLLAAMNYLQGSRFPSSFRHRVYTVGNMSPVASIGLDLSAKM